MRISSCVANDDAVQAILTDPYFNSLAHFDDLTATQQYKFTTEHHETTRQKFFNTHINFFCDH